MTKSNRQLRAALYARVSTTGHGQDVGLQLDELRQVADQRGWKVVEFVDDGISGTKEDRPALNDLMAAVSKGQIDIVVVWRLDRLGRSLQQLLRLLEHFRSCGAQFVSIHDPGMDGTSPSGRLMQHLIGAFCQFEAEIIKERVTAGVRRAQAAGKHCGRPTVAIDLRPAVAMLDQGRGLKDVAAILQVSRNTLRRRLREAGEWPRIQGGHNPSASERPESGHKGGHNHGVASVQ